MRTVKQFLALACLLVMAFAGAGAASGPWHGGIQASSRVDSVIVNTYGDFETAVENIAATGVRIAAQWPFIRSVAVEVPAGNIADLTRVPGVALVLPNNPVITTAGPVPVVDDSHLQSAYNYAVRADRAWAKGYDGRGITVAVVDSGLNYGPASDFSRVMAAVNIKQSTASAADGVGHGTHVAGIIAGNGNNSGGRYIGIAPGVNLVSVKYADDQGNATEQDLITALQWVYDHRNEYQIRVVNISASVNAQASYKESPTAAAVEQLWSAGIVVVAAAGNYGTEACAVCRAPASDPYVITVGAVDDGNTKNVNDDYMKSWSSYGRTKDSHFRPDVMAPGARIVSYLPSGSLRVNGRNTVSQVYFRMGGTSMSAPVVAGAVALLLQARPTLTPDQVKWLLTKTTRSYQDQPEGTPGVIAIDYAIGYTAPIGAANGGLTPSPLLNGETKTIDYQNVYWGNVYWANAYWANVYWAYSIDY